MYAILSIGIHIEPHLSEFPDLPDMYMTKECLCMLFALKKLFFSIPIPEVKRNVCCRKAIGSHFKNIEIMMLLCASCIKAICFAMVPTSMTATTDNTQFLCTSYEAIYIFGGQNHDFLLGI